MAGVASPRAFVATRQAMPPVSTVYRALDGGIHHARCNRRIEFMGGRAGLELDFYCFTCCEHVTLNSYVLARLREATYAGHRPHRIGVGRLDPLRLAVRGRPRAARDLHSLSRRPSDRLR